MPSTRSDRLIFANAFARSVTLPPTGSRRADRASALQLLRGDALGVRRNVDAKHLRLQLDVGLDLGQRQRQIETPRLRADETNDARQAVGELIVVGAPAPLLPFAGKERADHSPR